MNSPIGEVGLASELVETAPWRCPGRRNAFKTYSRAPKGSTSHKSETLPQIESPKTLKLKTEEYISTAKGETKGKINAKTGAVKSPSKENQCLNCDRIFSTPAGFGRHSRSCKAKPPVINVEQQFTRGKKTEVLKEENLDSDNEDTNKRKSPTNEKQCSNCPRTFDSLTGLRRHARTCKSKPLQMNRNHAFTEVRICDAEQQVLKLKSKFEKLGKLKNVQKENRCSNCPRTFDTLAGLCRHSRKCKSKASVNEMNIKSVNMKNSQPLKEVNLVKQHENSNERTRSKKGNWCSNCSRKFNTLHALRKHSRTCKSKKQDEDAKSYEEENNQMEQDLNTTTESESSDKTSTPHKGNQCSYCARTFSTLAGLCRHSRKCKLKPPEIDVDNTSNDTQNNQTLEQFLNLDSKFGNINSSKYEIIAITTCHCCGEDLETAHSVGEYQCNECNKLFRLKSSLERHLSVIHQAGENHECPQCGAKCPDKGTLARHMYTHTGLKPYSCPVCKQEFSRKYHLVRHNMQTGCDGKEKPVFPCQVCGRVFNRKDNLREHLRAHAGQTKRKKIFACDTCGMEFCGTNLLQLHKRSHTGEKPYICDFCPKRFTSSGALKKHRRTHTGERPYECQTCQKRFAAKETLNRHVRIHTGFKPHCCRFCGKRFIQSSQLRSHLFYHTGQSVLKPGETFTCDLCGKKFNRRTRLNEHIKYIHLGAKPFECSQCPKTFIRKEDLNRHLIIHSGVKSHICPICGKAFAMKSSLKVHLLTHTKEPPRSCDECGRAFIRQDCLLRHMRNKHRDMLEEIMCEAEKKKLQQQLLQVAAEASIEGLEDKQELDDNELCEAVRELLTLLVDEATLRGLGWPSASVEALLEAVIVRCGHDPAPPSVGSSSERLRVNIKLLFTVVINDSAIKALLNNQTVDEVILHVLRLAKP